MHESVVKILLIEDSPSDADLLQVTLHRAGAGRFEFTCEERLDDALTRLGRESFDVLLVDLSLPDSTGLDTMRRAHKAAPGAPIVVLTGTHDESLGLAAVQEGAQDYLVKGESDGRQIGRAIRYAIERKHAEEALRAAQERLRLAQSNAGVAVWAWNPRTGEVASEPELEQLYGLSRGTIRTYQDWSQCIHPDDLARCEREREAMLAHREPFHLEFRIRHPSGEVRWIAAKGKATYSEGGEALQVLGINIDITAQKLAEAALRESEQRYAAIFDKAPYAMALTRMPEGILADVNDAFLNLFESTRDEVIGKTSAEVELASADLQAQVADELKARGLVRDFECARVTKSGAQHILSLNLDEVSIGGKPHILTTIRDITKRRKAEQELFASSQRLATLMNALPVGVSISEDASCQRITGNPAMLAQFDVTPADNLSASATDPTAPGRRVRYFRDGREITDVELPMQRAVAENREIPPMELEVHLPSGRRWFTAASGAPIRDQAGGVVGGVAVTADITELKRAEESLQQAQKLESIGVLAGGIAHDFNNLLTSILGNASLLQMDARPESSRQISAIIQSSEAAASLTRQLLAYAGKGHFEITDFELSRLVRSLSDLLRISIPKNVAFQLDVPPNLPAVRGDPSQIQQVVMNLVLNAAEALAGREGGRVSINAGVQECDAASASRLGSGVAPGRYISVTVRDNGCGMDEQTKARIFDPFFTTKFTGRGLGLAAVHGILRSHRGTITVESSPGQGSTFTVYLPCGEAQAASGRKRARPAGRQAATVLVIEDEDVVRAFTQAALERAGHRVLLAENGRQALELLADHADVDLVVLDILLPVLGGVEAFTEMRTRWPKLAVLVASAYSRQEAHRLGVPDQLPFIEKPYTARVLTAAVAKVLKARARKHD